MGKIRDGINNWLDQPMKSEWGRTIGKSIKKYGNHSIAAGLGIGFITSDVEIAHYVGGVITALATYSAIDKAVKDKE